MREVSSYLSKSFLLLSFSSLILSGAFLPAHLLTLIWPDDAALVAHSNAYSTMCHHRKQV